MNVVFPDIVLFANLLLFLCVLHAKQTKILESRIKEQNRSKKVSGNKQVNSLD